ncbi:GNAT family N-acetyltransferase [Alkalilimnicola ehrlichii MLHE-1]
MKTSQPPAIIHPNHSTISNKTTQRFPAMRNSPPVERIRLPVHFAGFTLGGITLRLSVDKSLFIHDKKGRRNPERMGPHGFLARSSPEAPEFPRLSLDKGFIRYVPRVYRRHYIDLSQGWETYLHTFSGKSRQSIRRKIRKFEKASEGELEWRCYKTENEIRRFLELARGVADVSYQKRLLGAALPDSQEFYDAAISLAQNDQVRGFLLFHSGDPVAYLYCPAQDGVLRYRFLGYKPNAATLSPGTILQWLALDNLFKEGRFQYFDFCEGDAPHKAFFGSHCRVCGDIYWLKLTPKTIAAVVLNLSSLTLSEGLSWFLDQAGLKDRIRRSLRGR